MAIFFQKQKEIFSLWWKNKLFFSLIVISGLALGSALQYNWALDHNFWKDFVIRISLGGPIIIIAFFSGSSILIYYLLKLKIQNIEQYIKKISISLLVFILTATVFLKPEIRFKIFVIAFVLFLALFTYLFNKELSVLFAKIFPSPPCKLQWEESVDDIKINISGLLTEDTISYLYDSLSIEEDGLPKKKIILNLEKIEKIDEKGYYLIIHLISKTKMAGREFDLIGDPTFSVRNQNKKITKKEILQKVEL